MCPSLSFSRYSLSLSVHLQVYGAIRDFAEACEKAGMLPAGLTWSGGESSLSPVAAPLTKQLAMSRSTTELNQLLRSPETSPQRERAPAVELGPGGRGLRRVREALAGEAGEGWEWVALLEATLASVKEDMGSSEAGAEAEAEAAVEALRVEREAHESTRAELAALTDEYERLRVYAKKLKKKNKEAEKSKPQQSVNAPFSIMQKGGKTKFTSCADLGLVSDLGGRSEQQDAYAVVDRFERDTAYFGVYDGHSGLAASSFVALSMHNLLLGILQDRRGDRDYGAIFHEAYAGCDQTLKDLALIEDGTTAVSLILTKAKAKQPAMLHWANVGDSLAVLSRRGAAVLLSESHNADQARERARIEALADTPAVLSQKGGDWRVTSKGNPFGLQICRSLGDHLLKDMLGGALVPTPSTGSEEIQAGDSYVILASDGLFEPSVCTPQQAVDMAERMGAEGSSCQEIGDALLDMARAKKSSDNTTVIVLRLSE